MFEIIMLVTVVALLAAMIIAGYLFLEWEFCEIMVKKGYTMDEALSMDKKFKLRR